MDVRILVAVSFALLLAGNSGCRKSRSPARANPAAFPTVLQVGKETTRETLDAAYPGSAAYLTALQTPSNRALIERVRELCPYETVPPGKVTCAWRELSKVEWGPYRAILLGYGQSTHQVILDLKDGRYRLLLLDTLSDLGGEMEVVQVAGQAVLAYHAGMSGTGVFEVTGYFVLDDQSVPRVVHVDSTIRKALDKVLPQGFHVAKGGGFDLARLRFIHVVWRPGDGNCCPMGGRIRIDFDLVGDTLIPTRFRYDPSFSDAKGPSVWESGSWELLTDYPS